MDTKRYEIKVFISCPGDVDNEKKSIKKTCDDLNKISFIEQNGVYFSTMDWKDLVGEVGYRPQDIINRAFDRYNIYIGIMWMRFGTPTGAIDPENGKEYGSGTQEEFELAYKKKVDEKQQITICFFFKKPNLKEYDLQKVEDFKNVVVFQNQLKSSNLAWLNHFNKQPEFVSKITTLLLNYAHTFITTKKQEKKRNVINKQKVGKASNLIPKSDSDGLTPKLQNVPFYIQRTLTDGNFIEDRNQYFHFDREENKTLIEIVEKEKRIVILGNAGSGKSIELEHLADYHSKLNTSYIPIHKRLNTYKGEDFELFLPDGWETITEDVLLIILDGLDEIEPTYFNIAVRKLIAFSEKHEKLNIVVASRSNFYELPSNSFSGTLSGFKCFFMDELKTTNIINYASKQHLIDGNSFYQEAYREHYVDLIGIPFFLNIFIQVYQNQKNLTGGRAKIFETFINLRIDADAVHFPAQQIEANKQNIIGFLEKIALFMEATNKQEIEEREALQVLKNKVNFDLLKYSTTLKKKEGKNDVWAFEHNNIREYLASKALARQSFDTIKKFISFSPDYTRLKPTWINTLSFLVSIADSQTVDQLFEWLITTDPETIVKFESDRVPEQKRFSLFKQIFNFYKDKNIWLRSNKFNDKELARFAFSRDTITFLLAELNKTSSNIVRLNSLRILEEYSGVLDKTTKKSLKNLLSQFLSENSKDNYFIYSILLYIADMKLYDNSLVIEIVKKFRKRSNQYIRAGLYELINSANLVDSYVDVYIEGIALSDGVENVKVDRDSVSFASESWNLKEGLIRIKKPTALTKIFSFLANPEDGRHNHYYDRHDVFVKLIENAAEAYQNDSQLFNSLFDIFKSYARFYDTQYINALTHFFEKTGTTEQAFNILWHHADIKDHEKEVLISCLIDSKIIDLVLSLYKSHDFTNDDLLFCYHALTWNIGHKNNNSLLVKYFESRIEKETSIAVEKPQPINFEKARQQKKQRSFDLLFHSDKLLQEFNNFFKRIGKSEVTFEDTQLHFTSPYYQSELLTPECILHFLRDFTRNNRTIRFSSIEKWIRNVKKFSNTQIHEIFEYLKNSKDLHLTEDQTDFIKKWVEKTITKTKISKAIEVTNGNHESFTVDSDARILWFFISHLDLDIDLTNKKLLDFSLFDDFDRGGNLQEDKIFAWLELKFGKSELSLKIEQNLANGIAASWIWKKNALFAIDNGLDKVFPTILKELLNENRTEYTRKEVLTSFYKKTNDSTSLKTMLKKIKNEQVKWGVIDLLTNDKNNNLFLINYLLRIIKGVKASVETKLLTSSYLIKLNNTIGLKYYVDNQINGNNKTGTSASPDFHNTLSSFRSFNNIEGLNILLELLKFSRLNPSSDKSFDNPESLAIEGIHNIAISSEQNLVIVKQELNKFIDSNKGILNNLEFFHFTIQKMEEQFYQNQSKSVDIDTVINDINKLK